MSSTNGSKWKWLTELGPVAVEVIRILGAVGVVAIVALVLLLGACAVDPIAGARGDVARLCESSSKPPQLALACQRLGYPLQPSLSE